MQGHKNTGYFCFSLLFKSTDPPKIVISRVKREREVAAQESVTLSCVAEGNPQPNYTWTPCDPQQSVCHESKLIIREVFEDINYTCRVENIIGSDTADISVGKNMYNCM